MRFYFLGNILAIQGATLIVIVDVQRAADDMRRAIAVLAKQSKLPSNVKELILYR